MGYSTEIKLNLTLKLRGKHKTIKPQEISNYIKARIKNANIGNIEVLGTEVIKTEHKINQIVRQFNLCCKILKAAMPKFLAERSLSRHYDRSGRDIIIYGKEYEVTVTEGYVTFQEDNTVLCKKIDRTRLNCRMGAPVEAPITESFHLSDPEFVTKFRNFWGAVEE